GAVRKQLRDCRLRNRRVEALHVLAGAVVETELALFAKLHDAGSGETLGMRRDTKAMTWRQRRLADNIGKAEGPFEDDPAIMHNGNDGARLLALADLIFEPAWDVIERRLQPLCHVFVPAGVRPALRERQPREQEYSGRGSAHSSPAHFRRNATVVAYSF